MEQIKISETDKQLARFFKALGNPVRFSIIRTLIEKSVCPNGCNPCACGDKCEGINCKCGCRCGELVDMLPMSQSTVSQHIKELKTAGLIDTKGRKGDYVLNHQRLYEGLDAILSMTGYDFANMSGANRCHCCEKIEK